MGVIFDLPLDLIPNRWRAGVWDDAPGVLAVEAKAIPRCLILTMGLILTSLLPVGEEKKICPAFPPPPSPLQRSILGGVTDGEVGLQL
jgi:hypothetical protein